MAIYAKIHRFQSIQSILIATVVVASTLPMAKSQFSLSSATHLPVNFAQCTPSTWTMLSRLTCVNVRI